MYLADTLRPIVRTPARLYPFTGEAALLVHASNLNRMRNVLDGLQATLARIRTADPAFADTLRP
jgi:hypothetical protein